MIFAGTRKCLRAERGFTLVEMVVVLVLVLILAAVAVPVYTDYQNRVRRKEGEAAAFTVLTAAKTYYYRNGDAFTGSTCTCGANTIWLNTAEICRHWNITYTPAAQSVTITATGQNEYAGLGTITLIFNATTGITTINGKQV